MKQAPKVQGWIGYISLPYISDLLSSELDFVFLEELSVGSKSCDALRSTFCFLSVGDSRFKILPCLIGFLRGNLDHRTNQQTSKSSKGLFPWSKKEWNPHQNTIPLATLGFSFIHTLDILGKAFAGWFYCPQEGWYEETPPLLPPPSRLPSSPKAQHCAAKGKKQRTASMNTTLGHNHKNT